MTEQVKCTQNLKKETEREREWERKRGVVKSTSVCVCGSGWRLRQEKGCEQNSTFVCVCVWHWLETEARWGTGWRLRQEKGCEQNSTFVCVCVCVCVALARDWGVVNRTLPLCVCEALAGDWGKRRVVNRTLPLCVCVCGTDWRLRGCELYLCVGWRLRGCELYLCVGWRLRGCKLYLCVCVWHWLETEGPWTLPLCVYVALAGDWGAVNSTSVCACGTGWRLRGCELYLCVCVWHWLETEGLWTLPLCVHVALAGDWGKRKGLWTLPLCVCVALSGDWGKRKGLWTLPLCVCVALYGDWGKRDGSELYLCGCVQHCLETEVREMSLNSTSVGGYDTGWRLR